MRSYRLTAATVGTAALLVGGLSLTAGGQAAHAAGTNGQPTPTGSVELTWQPTYMSDNQKYTQTEAVALAKRVDLIAAHPVSFRDYIPAMKAANPHLTVIAYSNAEFTSTSAKGFSESEYAHNKNGNRIKSVAFGSYMMEPSNAAWRSASVNTCQSRATDAHYDGCLLDMLTMGIYSKNYVTSLPAVPGTNTEYTQSQWRAQLVKLAQQFHTTYPNLVIAGNSVSNAFRYWQNSVSSRPIVMALPSAQMEDFLRGARDAESRFPSVAVWQENVDVITDIESSGHTGLFSTKLWVNSTAAQIKQWQAYAMATFLMGANGHSYFAFTDARTKAGSSGTDQPYTMPESLGKPSGAMSQAGDLYRRNFAGGIVLVNPGTSSASMSLGGSYRTLDGKTVSSVTMAPHTGQVLVKS